MTPIAILTFHKAYNCGALLQAWALQTVLQRLGFDPAFPDCTCVGFFKRFEPVWYKRKPSAQAGWFARLCFRLRQELGALGVEDRKRWRFRRFTKRFLNLMPMEAAEVERAFPAVIVGSDQVWSEIITKDETPYFRTTLFANPALKRYSYAISLGDAAPDAAVGESLTAAAKLFENLSLRENLLPQLTDRQGNLPTVDPDPTLLLTKEDFDCIAYPKRLERKKYLFVYSLIYSEATWKAARTMAKEMGLKPVFALVYQYGTYLVKDTGNVHIDVSPDRFLAYIRDAEAVVTSSFHGTALSLVYGKRFATLPYLRGKVSFRCVELLAFVGEEVHRIDDPDDLARLRKALSTDVNPETIARLQTRAQASIARLAATLAPHKRPRVEFSA